MTTIWNLYRNYDRKINKQSILPTVVFIISIFILLITNIASAIIHKSIDKTVLTYAQRTITVEGLEDFAWYDLLEKEFGQNPDIEAVEFDTNGILELQDIPDGFPLKLTSTGEITKQMSFHAIQKSAMDSCPQTEPDDRLAENEILIPKYMFRSGHINSASQEYIAGEQFIGKTLQCDLCGQQTTFVIRGVYDNAAEQDIGTIYLSANTARSAAARGNLEYRYSVVVQNYEDLDFYKSKIRTWYDRLAAEAQITDPAGSIQTNHGLKEDAITFANALLIVSTILAISAMAWACFGMLLSRSKSVNARRQEFGLLKAVGYQDRQLCAMLRMESAILSLRVLLIAGGFTFVIATGYGIWVLTQLNVMYRIILPQINPVFLFFILAADFLVPMLAGELAVREVKKITPIEALR